MSNFDLPEGQETSIIIMVENASENAELLAELINLCVERHLKVKHVEAPREFEWKAKDGEPMQINNYFNNKAIFTFVPA